MSEIKEIELTRVSVRWCRDGGKINHRTWVTGCLGQYLIDVYQRILAELLIQGVWRETMVISF